MRVLLFTLILLTQEPARQSGVISGTVLSLDGTPAVNVTVSAAVAPTGASTSPTLLVVQRAQTDAQGQYRFAGLPPGSYRIAAGGVTSCAAAAASPIVSLPCAPGVRRGITQGSHMTLMPDSVWAYFPGGTDIARASNVIMTAGETRSGTDFQLVFPKVTGRVVRDDPNMAPGEIPAGTRESGLSISVQLRSVDSRLASSGGAYNSSITPTGTFEFPSVRPGSYRLSASASCPGCDYAVSVGASSIDVVVGDKNLSEIRLRIPARLTTLRVEGRWVDGKNAPEFPFFELTFTSRDYTLSVRSQTSTIRQLPPGEYKVTLARPLSEATVQSLTSGTTNLLETNLVVRDSGLIEVTLILAPAQ